MEIRSASDNRLLASLPASAALMVYNAWWSAAGRFLAVKRDYDAGGKRADLEVWEVAAARRVLLLRDVPWGAMSFHPRLDRFMAGGKEGKLTVWNLEDGSETDRLKLTVAPEMVRYSPDAKRLAALLPLENGWLVSVHDAASGAPMASQAFSNRVSSLDWHPGGRWIAVSDYGSSVHLMDPQTGESRTLGRHKAQAVLTTFSPDGHYLISGGWERELICWDLQAMRRAFTIGLDGFHLQFRSDGGQCAVAQRTGALQLHAFERPIHHREFAEDLGARLANAAFSPDGRWLAASGDDRLGVWDSNGHGPGALAGEGAEARFFFTPDGSELFVSCRADDAFRWRITPGTNAEAAPQLERLDLRKPGGFTSLCLISNVVAMTGSKGTRLVTPDSLAAEDDRWARTYPGISAASPDGRWLGIHRPYTPSLYVYRLPGLERVAKLTHPANIGIIKFSPLGDEVAIMSRGRVEFWSTTTWERTQAITNFMRMLYAPDARTWWLTKDSLTAGLYDAHTLELLLPLPAGMFPLALSPDGRQLAVSVNARRLQVWDVAEVRERLRELGLDWNEGKTANPR